MITYDNSTGTKVHEGFGLSTEDAREVIKECEKDCNLGEGIAHVVKTFQNQPHKLAFALFTMGAKAEEASHRLKQQIKHN